MISEIAEPLQVLGDGLEILNRLSIPYVIGGSFASGVYGEFRATQDIDIVAQFDEVILDDFITLARNKFYLNENTLVQQIASGESFNMIHEQTVFKIDFFTKRGEFEETQIKRAIEFVPEGVNFSVRVLSAEDVILAKLLWYKIGGAQSGYQWKDLLMVQKYQSKKLDIDYLQTWAKKIKVSKFYEKLTKEAI